MKLVRYGSEGRLRPAFTPHQIGCPCNGVKSRIVNIGDYLKHTTDKIIIIP
jgi:hypothetical protein